MVKRSNEILQKFGVTLGKVQNGVKAAQQVLGMSW